MARQPAWKTALGVIATLWLCGCGDGTGERGTAPVVLIGIDGAEWTVIESMIADGELPNLARIRQQGAWGWLLNPGPAVSPVAWTTIATGHFGRRHGILAHTYPYTAAGGQRPVSSDLRLEPALWNIATHYGKRSVVIGYFVTHPAEHINGVMVSPRAPRGLEGSITPPGALDLQQARYRELGEAEVQKALWSDYFGWPFDRDQLDDPQSPYRVPATIVTEKNLDRRIVEDEFLRRASLDLLTADADLFINYYRVTDFMSHSLWLYYDETDPALPPDAFHRELFDQTLRQSYRFVDAAVGEVLEAHRGKANVLIVSDHGFGAARIRPGTETRIDHLTGDHRPNGILLAIGPDIQPGEVRGVTVMEVAPTVLALLDIPLADTLPGDVAVELLRPEFLETGPVPTVADYRDVGVVRSEVTPDPAAEETDMNELRGLGYIGGDVGPAERSAAARDFDFWAVDEGLLGPVLASEAVYFLLRGDLESAHASVELVRRHRPDLARDVLRKAQHKIQRMAEQLPEGYLDAGSFQPFFEANGLNDPGDA